MNSCVYIYGVTLSMLQLLNLHVIGNFTRLCNYYYCHVLHSHFLEKQKLHSLLILVVVVEFYII